jgi:hypothetical protein
MSSTPEKTNPHVEGLFRVRIDVASCDVPSLIRTVSMLLQMIEAAPKAPAWMMGGGDGTATARPVKFVQIRDRDTGTQSPWPSLDPVPEGFEVLPSS